MNENKTGKYFKYAIGEIILVVIGILIALQINNWNEDRKLASQENLYLTRLLSDNNQDLITFSKFIEDLEKGNESINLLSEALNNESNDDTLLIRRAKEFLKYGSIFPIFTSSKATIEDLLSTGNITVISNKNLRDSIVKHYAKHDEMQDRIQVSTDWTLPIDGVLYSENDIMKFEPTTTFLFPKASNEMLASELKNARSAYLRNMAAHYWINEDAIIRFRELMKLTSILIESMENELDNHD